MLLVNYFETFKDLMVILIFFQQKIHIVVSKKEKRSVKNYSLAKPSKAVQMALEKSRI